MRCIQNVCKKLNNLLYVLKSYNHYIIAHVNLKINEYTDSYPDSIEFLKIEDIPPHAINLGIRIKETFGCQIQ